MQLYLWPLAAANKSTPDSKSGTQPMKGWQWTHSQGLANWSGNEVGLVGDYIGRVLQELSEVLVLPQCRVFSNPVQVSVAVTKTHSGKSRSQLTLKFCTIVPKK